VGGSNGDALVDVLADGTDFAGCTDADDLVTLAEVNIIGSD